MKYHVLKAEREIKWTGKGRDSIGTCYAVVCDDGKDVRVATVGTTDAGQPKLSCAVAIAKTKWQAWIEDNKIELRDTVQSGVGRIQLYMGEGLVHINRHAGIDVDGNVVIVKKTGRPMRSAQIIDAYIDPNSTIVDTVDIVGDDYSPLKPYAKTKTGGFARIG